MVRNGYMAAGRAIVAADQPHNREILEHERNALLFEAESLESLVQGIRRAIAGDPFSRRMEETARQDAGRSYANRAQTLLDFFEHRLSQRRSRLSP